MGMHELPLTVGFSVELPKSFIAVNLSDKHVASDSHEHENL